jgi:hypothetical protein
MRRWLLVIGAACAVALLFVVLLMYRVLRNEDAANAPVPVDEETAEQQLMVPDPPANSKPREPSKPDKPPPLNER